MLTDYFVRCPFPDCNWKGCLFPKGKPEMTPVRREIAFECPTCHREWQARIVGDDAVPLPLPETVATGV
jgi:hypothetical protein